MSPARASIVCYYDVVSPYSYFGVKLLNRYKSQPQWKEVDVLFRPTFLAGVMSGAKNQPPATVAAKGTYMHEDLNRISTTSGIPLRFPSQFPLMTVLSMRLLIAIQKHDPAKYEQCIEKLYEEYWVNDKDITQQDVLVSALSPILGSDAKVQEYLAMAGNKEIKQELIDNTQLAVDIGAFGAPTFVVKKAGAAEDDDLMFFGSDRFELMASLLGLPYYGLAPLKTSSKL